MKFMVDFWYRHQSDTDQSLRTHPQMSAPLDDDATIHARIAELRAQGYHVQRVMKFTTCVACQGQGRIGTRPKGRRKAVPAWMMTWTRCAPCDAKGSVDAVDINV